MPDWHPEDIKAALRKRYVTLKAFADELDVKPAAISIAIHSRSSTKIEERIARAIGVRPNVIWPSRYRADGQRILYRARRSQPEAAA